LTKDEALKMAIDWFEVEKGTAPTSDFDYIINACKEALEQPSNMVTVPLDKLQDMQRRLKALEQPAQEPVAWIDVNDKLPKQLDIVLVSGKHKSEKSRSGNYELVDTATYYDWTWEKNGTKGWLSPRFGSDYDEVTHWMPLPKYPLYTHPHQWQGLTDDEIEYWECLKAPPVHPDFLEDDSWREFARCIEQALKEKNI